MASTKNSPEYHSFKDLEHWQAVHAIFSPQDIFENNSKLLPLFSCICEITKNFYQQVPQRKDGENAFIHPLNVVLTLKKAKVDDAITLCAGLLHDFVEEKVDIFKEAEKIGFSEEGIILLEKKEQEVFENLECDLTDCSPDNFLAIKEILETVKLLTRQKRYWYYRSVSSIFTELDLKIKERAIQIKLADRMHNILCITCFNEEERAYQCYKNLFILNNAKKFLIDQRGEKVFSEKELTPTEKLFKKCAKATYDAFLTICRVSQAKGIDSVVSLLQLAFKKFAIEKKGLWEVTLVDHKETHPLRLYQGLIYKYDARLYHEWKKFELMKREEFDYCQKFLLDYNFTPEQLQAVIYYKDAYSLREVITYLLYQPDYFISRFLCSELSEQGRIMPASSNEAEN